MYCFLRFCFEFCWVISTWEHPQCRSECLHSLLQICWDESCWRRFRCCSRHPSSRTCRLWRWRRPGASIEPEEWHEGRSIALREPGDQPGSRRQRCRCPASRQSWTWRPSPSGRQWWAAPCRGTSPSSPPGPGWSSRTSPGSCFTPGGKLRC